MERGKLLFGDWNQRFVFYDDLISQLIVELMVGIN